MSTFVRINLKYNAGGQEEILCDLKTYEDDAELFAKHYKKLLKWLNKDHNGAALVRVSKFLRCDDIFVSAKNLMSINTDIVTFSDDLESNDLLDIDPISKSFENLDTLVETNTKILDTLSKINSKIEKPKKKALLEGKKNAKANSKV